MLRRSDPLQISCSRIRHDHPVAAAGNDRPQSEIPNNIILLLAIESDKL